MTKNNNDTTNTFQVKIGKKIYIVTAKPSPNAKRTIDDAFKTLCQKEITDAASLAA